MLPLNFELEKYDYSLYEWYSPVFVALMYDQLGKIYPEAEEHTFFKKAREAVQGALTILGSRSLHESNAAVMQMNRQSQRPDVISAIHSMVEGLPTLKVSPLEITTLEHHTKHEDLAKFLMEKKLSKDYPPETIFICWVNKVLQFEIRELAQRIKPLGKSNTVYILGKVADPNSAMFHIATPQTVTAQTTFDIAEQARNYPYPYRMSFSFDATNRNPKLTPITVEPIDLFDFFMLDKPRIEQVLGERKI